MEYIKISYEQLEDIKNLAYANKGKEILKIIKIIEHTDFKRRLLRDIYSLYKKYGNAEYLKTYTDIKKSIF